MSRPPAPPSLYPPNTTSSAPPPAMTETQQAPNFPPPPFWGNPLRELPRPVQLPPLSIPPDSSVRPHYYQHHSPITQHLPSIQSIPQPRQPQPQPRVHSGSSAPLEKLLSSNPFASPRSNPTYSPRRYAPSVSPRSEVDARQLHHHQQPQPQQHQHHQHQYQQQQQQQQPPRHLLGEQYRVEETPRRPPPTVAEPPLVSPVDQTAQRGGHGGCISSHSPGYPANYGGAGSSTTYHTPINPYRAPSTAAYAAPPIPVTHTEQPPSVSTAPPPHPAVSTVPSAPPPPTQSNKPELHYRLVVRQQPIAARACGFGERDRRVIDPPPIIQLIVTDPVTGKTDDEEMRYCLNVLHCTLWNETGTQEETALVQPDRRTTRRLMGQLVASPSIAKDEHDVEGCFFCFPDLSCRTHGRYRLRFLLLRIDPGELHVGGHTPILTEVLTDVFTVYTAKDFPGMRPSSALTRALKLQGCNIQVKKGNEKALLARKRGVAQVSGGSAGGMGSSAGEEEDDEGRGGSRRRRRE